MIRKFSFIHFLLIALVLATIHVDASAQDTLFHGVKSQYFSKTDSVRGKSFYSKLKRSREDVIFDSNDVSVEYCYYYDEERNFFGRRITILNDSIVRIVHIPGDSTEYWNYQKVRDIYRIWRQSDGLIHHGYTDSLIPFEFKWTIATNSAISGEILWVRDYSGIDYATRPTNTPTYSYPRTKPLLDVHTQDELDEVPTFRNGDTLPTLKLSYYGSCCCEPTRAVRNMSFIVTSSGEIINIEQWEGNVETTYCPDYVLGLMKMIDSFGTLSPGKINGKAVYSRVILPVDMLNQHHNRVAQHPAFDRKETTSGKKRK